MCRIFSSLTVDVNTISRIYSIFFNFLNNMGGFEPGIYPRLRTSTAAFGPAFRNGCRSLRHTWSLRTHCIRRRGPMPTSRYLPAKMLARWALLCLHWERTFSDVSLLPAPSFSLLPAPSYVLAAVAIVLARAAHTLAGALNCLWSCGRSSRAGSCPANENRPPLQRGVHAQAR